METRNATVFEKGKYRHQLKGKIEERCLAATAEPHCMLLVGAIRLKTKGAGKVTHEYLDFPPVKTQRCIFKLCHLFSHVPFGTYNLKPL